MSMEKKYKIRLAEENDTRKISEFIEKYKVMDKSDVEKTLFVNDKVRLNDYSKLVVRFYLYNFKEEFIIVENNNEIESLVSIGLPKDKSRAFTLNLMLLKDECIDLIKEIFDFAIFELNEKSIIKPTKIRTFLSLNNKCSDFWINRLKSVGFKYEALRECESKDKRLLISLALSTIIQEEKVC